MGALKGCELNTGAQSFDLFYEAGHSVAEAFCREAKTELSEDTIETLTDASSICPDKMFFVLDKIRFVSDKIVLSITKYFLSMAKILSTALRKLV